ncbi:DMT family transporter [Sneathiella glossodoripedis]|uniref:DMT family transporter n=1 Tax=Sneathiella glossodoripedis TaxID=418853 RepID=UPI0004711317|nr:DMT family transporter [Sneathiella glossodoripedis]
MSLTITLLVLCSATLHPLWNLLIKKDPEPENAFLTLALIVALVGLVHGIAIGADFWLSPDEWLLVGISVAGQLLYSLSLIATLKRGDLSAYYPIIRASPVFIVCFSFLFLGKVYDWEILLGIALVIIGAVLLLYRRGVNLLSDTRTLALAILAMCGTGIYSLSDSQLMMTIEAPVLFFWVQIIIWPLLALIYIRNGYPFPAYGGLLRVIRTPVLHLKLAVCLYGSYFLILLAYEQGADVAIVTTVRQASIPLSVIIGGYFLNEGAILRRLFASFILSAGIITVILLG